MFTKIMNILCTIIATIIIVAVWSSLLFTASYCSTFAENGKCTSKLYHLPFSECYIYQHYRLFSCVRFLGDVYQVILNVIKANAISIMGNIAMVKMEGKERVILCYASYKILTETLLYICRNSSLSFREKYIGINISDDTVEGVQLEIPYLTTLVKTGTFTSFSPFKLH